MIKRNKNCFTKPPQSRVTAQSKEGDSELITVMIVYQIMY